VPLASTEFSDGANVAIPLPPRGRRLQAELGVTSRWNEHSHSVSFTLHLGRLVDGRRIVTPIGRDGCYPIVDPLEKGRHPRTVSCPSASQVRCDDLTSICINRQVQFPPSPSLRRLSHVSDMNPEPRAVDEQMDRSIRGEPAKPNITELLKPPGNGRVIRDREIQLEQLGQRLEKALGLAKRKMEDHADGQSRLDGDVRIRALATGLPAGRFPPGVDRIF